MVSLTAIFGLRRHNIELGDAAREMRTLDLVLAQETGRTLQGVELVLQNVADQLDADGISTSSDLVDRGSTKAINDLLRARLPGVPQLDAITIISADGKLVNFSRTWPVPSLDLSDRDYFQFLRNNESADPYITEPVVNRGSGTTTIYLAHRLTSGSGAFIGLLLGAVRLEYFERFYNSLQLGSATAVSLWRRDGLMLARFPREDVPARIEPSVIMAPPQPYHGVTGVFERPTSIRGLPEARLIASQMAEGFPIIVNIARNTQAVLADWRRELLLVSGAIAFAVACIGVLMWALMRRFWALQAYAAAMTERGRAILERQEAEDALRQAQKMEVIGQLTGGVAHDFNNLLTVVRSSVDLLRHPGLSQERRERFIQAIDDASERAVRLTRQLLAFSRRQTLEPEVFDVLTNVKAVGELVDRLTGSRLPVQIRLPEHDACWIEADPNQFDTALVNLAVNSRDAMPDGGTLSITVAATESIPPIRSHPAVRGAYVAVTVEDTGSGIPPEMLDRVFEPFFTTKKVGEGTGLGLSQVFGFAKQSGGEVQLVSVPGKGTAVTLFLPRVAAPSHALRKVDPTHATDPAIAGEGRCVLVVEDDEQVGVATVQTLEALSYETVWAKNGTEALGQLEAGAGRFSLVLSDVVMPGMSGIELGRTIRITYPGLPVILTSGFSQTVAKHGSDGFPLVQKPFAVDELGTALALARAAPVALAS